MAKFDPGAVQAVKARVDIADVVRRYVDLRNVGGRLVGVCPFHHETKGSFNVHPDKGFYHCFGCQASGDVIDFFCRINGMEFKEGLEELAREAGVRLEGYRADPREAQKKQVKRACLEMHSLAEAYFRKILASDEGKRARDYLAGRKVGPAIVEAFGLGASPEGWQALADFLAGRGYKPGDGVTAGLLSTNDAGRTWDRFRGRLIFPIRDVAGRVVAFGGRIMGEGDPKYLNSADSPIYKKGEHLYGLSQARQTISRTRRAFLTEGYMDVITLHQFGYTDACGVLGTALTSDQVRRLTGFCNKVDLVFDGDPPGRKAALKAAEMILGHGASCRAVMLPEGEDVDSLLHGGGTEAFEACVKNARDGLEFCLGTVRETFSPKEIVRWAKDFLNGLADADLRAFFLPKAAMGLGLSERELRGALAAGSGTSRGAGERAAPRPARTNAAYSVRDAQLLAFGLRHPERVGELDQAGLRRFFDAPEAGEFWDVLARCDRETFFQELTEGEKAFAAGSLAREAPDAEADRQEFEDILDFIAARRKTDRLGVLKEDIRRAEASGDVKTAVRLGAELVALKAEG